MPAETKNQTAFAPSPDLADSRYQSTSINFEKRVLRKIKKAVRDSNGQFRSVSAWVNFHSAKLTGVIL